MPERIKYSFFAASPFLEFFKDNLRFTLFSVSSDQGFLHFIIRGMQ